jgi:hypothetical protein
MAVLSLTTICCKVCRQEKPNGEFYRVKNRQGHIYAEATCKGCRRGQVAASKQVAISDPGEAERRRVWRRDHKRKIRQAMRQGTGGPQFDTHVKLWRSIHRGKEYYRQWSTTPKRLLDGRICGRIRRSLRGTKAGRSWETLVGYTLDELVRHIERQFCAGMNWNNMGRWHIDHIRPLAMFNYTSPDDEDFRVAWALTNLRPLWAPLNLAKSDQRLFLI